MGIVMTPTELTRQIRALCGEPKRGRPSKECSILIQSLKKECRAKTDHTINKDRRTCRPKLKQGRPRKRTPTPRMRTPTPRMNSVKQNIQFCPDIKFTPEEKKMLKNPKTNKAIRDFLKSKCNSRQNSKGRRCKLHIPSGICKMSI